MRGVCLEMITRWYQATEPMIKGQYVTELKDGIRIKICNMVNEAPIGKIGRGTYTDNYIAGDKVLVELIWSRSGYLMETLIIGDNKFYIGALYDYVKRKLKGMSDDEYYHILDKKNLINKAIYKLEKLRDKL